MEKARKRPRDQGGDSPRVRHPPPTEAPVGSVDSDTHPIAGHRPEELKEASAPQSRGPIGDPHGSHLQAGATRESPSSPPAAPRRRRKTRAQEEKERVPKGDPEEEAQKMRVLLASFSEEQLNRYEAYRRAAFPSAAIRHVVQSAAGGARVERNAIIAMAGLAKVFVGEVVEEALDLCERWGETPPLQPKHLREAVRRLSNKGKAPGIKPRNVLFP